MMKLSDHFIDTSPVVQLVSQLLLQAHQSRASDLHFEPLEHALRIRVRIDGVLHEVQQLSKKLEKAVISRLKIMTGSMQIDEKRLPQDGRFHFSIGSQSIDVRAATMPTLHGESMVLRLLNPTSQLLELSQLGLTPSHQEHLKKLLHLPNGLLLMTGPTGSGKTTTLYGCLKELQQTPCKIITVEDPIEYRLDGINQVQTQEAIGLTFPTLLRAMLRHAPNKIIVGEIRDHETAQIAIQASLTGHLILSTLHTNDALSAVARLQEIGIPPFLIASGLQAIVAQRLVRQLCPHCKTPTTLSDYEQQMLGLEKKEFPVMKAVGCSRCHHKGFAGRLGIFEIFILDEPLRRLIHGQESVTKLRCHTQQQGLLSLRDDGIQKMREGLTTSQEVISNTLRSE